MSVEDYDTDDYYSQDVVPLSRLAHKYAARRFWSSFASGLFLNGEVSSTSALNEEQAPAVIQIPNDDDAFLCSSPRSKKPRRFCTYPSSSPSTSNSSGNGFLGGGDFAASEKGYENSDDIVLKNPMNSLDEEYYSEKGCCYKRRRLPDLNEPISSTMQQEPYYAGVEHADDDHGQEKVKDDQIIPNPKTQKKNNFLKIKIKKPAAAAPPSPPRVRFRFPVRVPEQPVNPVLPPEYRQMIESMGGKEVQFVISKELVETDLRKSQNRFPISVAQLGDRQFLRPEEDRKLKQKSVIMYVNVIDTKRVVWTLTLRSWPKFYALATHWCSLAKDNGLTPKNLLYLWCFRVNLELHFAVVKVR